MTNVLEVYNRAIKIFGGGDGSGGIGMLATAFGAIDGKLETVPANRREKFATTMEKMMSTGVARAQARADFEVIKQQASKAGISDDGDDDGRKKPPKTFDAEMARNIYAKWNKPQTA